MAEPLGEALHGAERRVAVPMLQSGYLRGVNAALIRELFLGQLRVFPQEPDSSPEGGIRRI